MSRLRDDTILVSTTANQAWTALPKAVGKLRRIQDHTNFRTVVPISLQELRDSNPGATYTAGFPERYAEWGWRQVSVQPVTVGGAAIFVKSTSASDTGTAFIEGVRNGGAVTASAQVMTGTTAVQMGSVTDYVEVTKFYLSTAALGEVTILEGSGAGVELARISVGEADARYLTVLWDPIPTSAQPLYIDYTRNVLDLVNDGDVPLLPLDFHWLIPCGVRLREYELTSDTRAQTERPEYEHGKNALKTWVLNSDDQLTSLRPSLPRGFSSLGAMFPAGS
jgi:hypothetical protein